MTFINERISPEDWNRFNLDAVDEKFIGGVKSREWTIDKERNIYLRCVRKGGIERFHYSTWTLFWQGDIVVFEVELKSSFGGLGEDAGSHKIIRNIDIPEKLQAKKLEILSDLKESLSAYKDGGVYSKAKKYNLILEIE